MLKKFFILFILAFVAGSAVASATQSDTLWSHLLWPNGVRDAKFTPSGDSVVVIAGDYDYVDSLFIINTSSGTILKKTILPFLSVRFTLFHNSTKMVIRGYYNEALIWDYAGDTLVKDLSLTGHAISVDVTPDDSKIIVGAIHKEETIENPPTYRILVYNLQLNAFTDSTADMGGGALAISISPDGQYIATSSHNYNSDNSSNDKLILWNLSDLQIIKDFGPTTLRQINDVKFSPNGKYIGVAREDGTVKVYSMDDYTLYRNFIANEPPLGEGPVRVCFSNNSSYIYTGLLIWNNWTTKMFDISNNELLYTYNTISYNGLDVSINEFIIAAGSSYICLLSPHWMSVDDSSIKNENINNLIFSKTFTNNKLFKDEIADYSYDIYNYLGKKIIASVIITNQADDILKNLNYGIYYLIFNEKHNRKIKKILIID